MRKQYDVSLLMKVENLVAMKMLKSKNGREARVEYVGKNKVQGFGGVNEFFFQKGSDGYSIYQGCDLVVGDTSLRSCVVAMLQICNM